MILLSKVGKGKDLVVTCVRDNKMKSYEHIKANRNNVGIHADDMIPFGLQQTNARFSKTNVSTPAHF